jgi:hypothetical protein
MQCTAPCAATHASVWRPCTFRTAFWGTGRIPGRASARIGCAEPSGQPAARRQAGIAPSLSAFSLLCRSSEVSVAFLVATFPRHLALRVSFSSGVSAALWSAGYLFICCLRASASSGVSRCTLFRLSERRRSQRSSCHHRQPSHTLHFLSSSYHLSSLEHHSHSKAEVQVAIQTCIHTGQIECWVEETKNIEV